MITAQHVRDLLTAVPFQPFRIVTSSGATYEVRHPEIVLVTRQVLYVGVYEPNRLDFPVRAALVSVLHVTDLQPLPTPVTSQ
jgi:hypothetical protein